MIQENIKPFAESWNLDKKLRVVYSVFIQKPKKAPCHHGKTSQNPAFFHSPGKAGQWSYCVDSGGAFLQSISSKASRRANLT